MIRIMKYRMPIIHKNYLVTNNTPRKQSSASERFCVEFYEMVNRKFLSILHKHFQNLENLRTCESSVWKLVLPCYENQNIFWKGLLHGYVICKYHQKPYHEIPHQLNAETRNEFWSIIIYVIPKEVQDRIKLNHTSNQRWSILINFW